MRIVKPAENIVERALDENTRSVVAYLQAVYDYNMMMEILENPNEEGNENV